MSTQPTVIADYREQKAKLDKLAKDAKKVLQARYTELLVEAAGIQSNFKLDFGVTPDLPASVKTFTLGDGKKKPANSTEAVDNGKKIGGLRRSLNAVIRNRENAADAGQPTEELDARIEELKAALKAAGADVKVPEPKTQPEPEAEETPESESKVPEEAEDDDDEEDTDPFSR